MSLINNMLKDLEKRRVQTNEQALIAYTYPTRRHHYFFSKKMTFGLLGLGLISSISFLFMPHHKTSLAIPAVNKHVANTAEPSSTPSFDTSVTKWTQAASITGVTAQLKGNITELSFFIDHPVLYRLTTSEMKNQFSITFDHTDLQSELPVLKFLNTAIQHITVQHFQGDTRFDLTLIPGATIKYVNLNDEDQRPELVIAVESQTSGLPSVVSKNAPAPVKMPAMQTLLAEQYQASVQDAENGNFQSAIGRLSALLKTDPTYKDARVSLAALLIDQGQTGKADHIIEAGLKLTPDYPAFIELKARLLSIHGKTAEALALLQTSSPPINDNPDYHAFVAALYQQTNHDMLAIKIYKELLTVNPENANWWLGLGVSLEKTGRPQAAMTAYSKALSVGNLAANSATYLQNRLMALQEGTHAAV